MPWVKAPRLPSPFSHLAQPEQERREIDFLELFDLCVLTTDEREEAWAYEKLKDGYVSRIISDRQPAFATALQWAAQVSRAEAPIFD